MSKWFRRTPTRPGDNGGEDSSGAASPHDNEGPQPPLSAFDPHELLHDWLRTLTIIGEGKSIDETLALIAKVNKVGTHAVPIRTVLPAEDRRAMEDVLAWNHEIRGRQAGVNLLVEQVLIRWLSEATGQTWSQIVQRLALALEDLLPPEQR